MYKDLYFYNLNLKHDYKIMPVMAVIVFPVRKLDVYDVVRKKIKVNIYICDHTNTKIRIFMFRTEIR